MAFDIGDDVWIWWQPEEMGKAVSRFRKGLRPGTERVTAVAIYGRGRRWWFQQVVAELNVEEGKAYRYTSNHHTTC